MKYEETARRLRKALSDNNMKAQELADKCGINKASISQYVNGSHKPSNIKAALMADVLGVSALWLMGFDQPIASDAELTSVEKELIETYRNLDKEAQRQLVLMLAFLKDQNNKK